MTSSHIEMAAVATASARQPKKLRSSSKRSMEGRPLMPIGPLPTDT